MDKAKQYDNRITKSNEKSQAEQEKAKNIISNVLDGNKNQFEPSISRSNFQGKHTKFENDELAESTTTKIIDSTDHIRKASSKKSKRLDKSWKKERREEVEVDVYWYMSEKMIKGDVRAQMQKCL
ncbi:Lrp1p [Saccharomyces cerevisiae Vin13]|nr:Lrp1p [Saccharomyces cerevisiae Vin13]